MNNNFNLYFLISFLVSSNAFLSLKWHQKIKIRQFHKSSIQMTSTASNTNNVDNYSCFIFGLGYVGCAVAKSLKDDGWNVSGTSTNIQKIQNLRSNGINAHLLDNEGILTSEGDNEAAKKEILMGIQAASHVLITIPPNDSDAGDSVLQSMNMELRNAVLNGNLKWIGYLSSTGVYGDCNGAWVSENDPINPISPVAMRRANAESLWEKMYSRSGLPIHIFRLAGIYGPKRSALDTLLKCDGNMQRAGADDCTYVSRIHVKDIVKILRLSMSKPQAGLILNMADDLPSTRYDVLAYACKLLKLPVCSPSTDNSYRMRGGSKRVNNDKLKQFLVENNEELEYPDYRMGLSTVYENLYKDPRSIYMSAEETSVDYDVLLHDSYGIGSSISDNQVESSRSANNYDGTNQGESIIIEDKFDSRIESLEKAIIELRKEVDYLKNSRE